MAVCKVKARSTIDCPTIAYQEDDVSHDHTINIYDTLERLCFETSEFEEVFPSENIASGNDGDGEVDLESDYESEFESSSKDD